MDGKTMQISSDPSGIKFDGGKPRFELTLVRALEAEVRVLTFGARKYTQCTSCSYDGLAAKHATEGCAGTLVDGAGNWRKVPGLRLRYLGAGLRHVFKYMRGEKIDSDSGESHLACAQCCFGFLLELDEEERVHR